MHKSPEIGIVREGMLADMVIVDQNPLQNFKVLYANGALKLNDKTGRVERVGGLKWTIKDGIAYDAKRLAADVAAMVEKQKRAGKTTTSQKEGRGRPPPTVFTALPAKPLVYIGDTLAPAYIRRFQNPLLLTLLRLGA